MNPPELQAKQINSEQAEASSNIALSASQSRSARRTEFAYAAVVIAVCALFLATAV